MVSVIEHWEGADHIGDVYTSDVDQIIEALDMTFESGQWVLDIGSGPGRILYPLREQYPQTHFVGLDISPNMVDGCPGVILGNGHSIPVLTDAAYSVNLFQHLEVWDQATYLAEVKRCVVGPFRFQFVFLGEQGPFSHPVSVSTMRELVGNAGLEVVAFDEGLVQWEWCWMTVQ
ncbi:MAG: class I SAM-dependent methyltransferase [Acidimicrobiia bacterium]